MIQKPRHDADTESMSGYASDTDAKQKIPANSAGIFYQLVFKALQSVLELPTYLDPLVQSLLDQPHEHAHGL